MNKETFTLPMAGKYLVRASCTRYEQIGTWLQPNPNKRWWQIWKPDLVLVPHYRRIETLEGTKTISAIAGQEIDPNIVLMRINN